MDLRKIKNNKGIAVIGVLTPLIIVTILISIIAVTSSRAYLFIATCFLSVVTIIYYTLMVLVTNKELIKVHKTRTVYTKCGIFFLYPKIKEEYIECSVYENKYWLYLSKVPIQSIKYRGDLDSFITNLDKELDSYYGANMKTEREQKELIETFNKWDGATDTITRRDKLIDEIV